MYRPSSVSEVTESGFALPVYDYVDNSGATTTSDHFVFKRGGSSGVQVATVIVNYTDTTKTTITNATKTVP